MKVNRNFLSLENSYLFSRIAKRAAAYKYDNPGTEIIRLGIGDVTRPLPDTVVKAMIAAAAEMGTAEGFRGYGPEQGYDFLRMAVAGYYQKRNVELDSNEIFISDGAKSDLANFLDLLSTDNTVMIPDPVYPVYVDSNIMAGRKILYMDASQDNAFLPMPDKSMKADIIYLCSPNNPTGAVYDRQQLEEWVEYALANDALILFDAAYEAFIQDPELPRSIYEIDGAKKCAVEFCSLSKMAGFTGTRCGYTIVPRDLEYSDTALNPLWLRRQTTKFNGVPYIVQRGAEAVFTTEGMKQCKENIAYYLDNAGIISDTLEKMRIWFTGGKNSPYIWLKCPRGMTSWEFFDELLANANVVGTPGSGFGRNGEGFFRLSSFSDRENVKTAMERIRRLY